MKTTKVQIIRWGILILSCVILITGSIRLLNQKESYFLDEYSSYGCANGENGKAIPFTNRTTYQASELLQLAEKHYAVSENARFRFDHVWSNLSQNVHPPVFYAALHFVCSLTPGVFSVWQGAVVNLLFSIISLVFFQKLIRAFTDSEWLAGGLCLSWACTQGLFSATTLIRDYAAAMCCCLIILWECVRFFRGHRRVVDLVKIALASSLGVLSHYYSAIYLFFLCAVLCVILMARKEWKDVFKIFAAEITAAGVTIAVFPSVISRILSSKRGLEAAENFGNANLTKYTERLVAFFRLINQSFFGSKLKYLLILVIILTVICIINRKKSTMSMTEAGERTVSLKDLCLLAIPAICYFALVSKIAPFKSVRYMYHVTAIMYLSCVAVLLFLGRYLTHKQFFSLGLAIIMLAVSAFTWSAGKINHLYIGLNQKQEDALEPYRGIEAVQLWKGGNYICTALSQYHYYSTVSLYHDCRETDLGQISALKEGRDVMVLLGKKVKDYGYVEKLLELYPGYTAEKLGCLDGQNRFINYYFHKEQFTEEEKDQ